MKIDHKYDDKTVVITGASPVATRIYNDAGELIENIASVRMVIDNLSGHACELEVMFYDEGATIDRCMAVTYLYLPDVLINPQDGRWLDKNGVERRALIVKVV